MTESKTVEPLEGKTSIDDKMFFGPEQLSYKSAIEAARRIGEQFGTDVRGQTVVIAGPSLLADFSNLLAVSATLDSLELDYHGIFKGAQALGGKREAVPPSSEETELADRSPATFAMTAALGSITATVSSALGLVSLFREDVEYRGIRTIVDPLAFELTLAAELKKQKAAKVFVPELFVIEDSAIKADSLRGKSLAVHEAQVKAWDSVAPFLSKLVDLEAELDHASREEDQALVDELTLQVSELRRRLDPVTEPLSRADQRLSELETNWQQTDEKTGISTFARLIRAEAIRNLKAKYVHAKVVSSGGHHRVSKHLLRTLFLGDGLRFTGGCIVRWALLEADGAVAKSGIVEFRKNRGFATYWGDILDHDRREI